MHSWPFEPANFSNNVLPALFRWASTSPTAVEDVTIENCKLSLSRVNLNDIEYTDACKFLDTLQDQPISELLSERSINKKFEDDVSVASTTEQWRKFWKKFADRTSITYADIKLSGKNTISSTHHDIRPLRIIPHLRVILAIVTYPDGVIFVHPERNDAWKPLNTVTRFYYNNFDTDSQAMNYLAVNLLDMFSRLSFFYFFPYFTPTCIEVDNALWLQFDLSESLKQKRRGYMDKLESDLDLHTAQWIVGELSNFDYILFLNQYAGRVRGEVHNHPIFPWVCDFSNKDGGWRDLNKTKYRLQKGDDQLREMFSRQPSHHIPELLSDIGYMVYRARVEDKSKLCKHVRSKWVPLEYPVSVTRMYEWTPDECIPEFYDDPSIFKSQHPDMPDLVLPPFVKSAEEFITWHRQKLESEEVSSQLHQWIDLTFGYKLSGNDAVDALNVHLCFVDRKIRNTRTNGMVQLFDRAHPKKLLKPNKTRISNDSNLISDESVAAVESRLDYVALLNSSLVTKETDNRQNCLDENDLFMVYSNLLKERKERRDVAAVEESQTSLLITLIELCVAKYVRGWFGTLEQRRKRAKRLIQQYGYIVPRNFIDTLRKILIENEPLPHHSQFLFNLTQYLSLPFDLTLFHKEIMNFYSFHHLRHTPAEANNEKLFQSFLIREIDAVRESLTITNTVEFVIVAIVERLLKDQTSCIQAVHRLMSALNRTLSDESLDSLMQPLTELLSCESSIKLLDRRFLLSVSIVYGAPKFLIHFLPAIVEAAAARQIDRSIVAKDSIMWLSKRYGPVVCAKFISSNLLRILASCYDGMLLLGKDQEPSAVFTALCLEGDEWGGRVEACLREISAMYSITFVTMQYLPFCVDLVEQAARRLTVQLETGFLSVFRIVRLSIKAMTDHQLMNYLEDYIVNKIILRVLAMTTSKDFVFSSERSRIIICARVVSLLYDVSTRVGAENSRMYAKKPFQLLFATIGKLYEADADLRIIARQRPDSDKTAEIPLWFVSSIIDRFAVEWGVPLLSSFCTDPAFIVPFISSQVASSSPTQSVPLGATYQMNYPSGNRIFSLSSPNSLSISSPSLGGSAGDTGSLSAVWCARVSSAVCDAGGNKTSYRFDHLSLCTFGGHSGAIRKIVALSNENSFISSSADKTIKLWSIKPEQDSVESQWTYKGHTRPVLDVLLQESNSVASTDGCLHVWDPFRGALLCQSEWDTEGSICGLARVDRHNVAAISSIHSTVKLLDTRVGAWTSEWKISPLPGVTRALSVSQEHKMVVALSNGSIVILDARTGKLTSLSNGNNTHTTTISWMSPTEFIVCDSDDEGAVFTATPHIEQARRLPDTVISASVYNNTLATIQSGGIIRMYRDNELVVEAKMKTDILPGTPTAIVHLPLNNAYLLGSSQGAIRLMC